MVALVVAACSAAAASADVPVVSATIYPGSSTRVLPLQALQECPSTDETQLYVPPPAPSSNLPSASTWTLATVLSCALQIPISDVTNVEVQRGNGSGFEQPLSNGDVVDPTLYQDPQDRNALPVVASNGPSGPNYYARPFRGGSDDNGRDGVTADGPITILVWVKSQPLVVAIKPHPVPGSKALKFSASVKTAEGTAVSPSSLKWQWTFQDTGETSTEPTPVHGSPWPSCFVSVQVTDSASGDAGTDTRSVTTPNKPAPGKQNQSGGHKHTNSKSPTGKDNGGSNDKPGGGYSSGQPGPTTHTHQPQTTQPSSPATNPTSTTPSTPTPSTPATTPATTPTTTPESTPTPSGPRPKRTEPQNTPPPATGTLVTGRLVADVTPLPQKSSPLVRATASAAPVPTVRQATTVTTSPWTAIGAGLAVAALLALGAWHELRGRRRSSTAH